MGSRETSHCPKYILIIIIIIIIIKSSLYSTVLCHRAFTDWVWDGSKFPRFECRLRPTGCMATGRPPSSSIWGRALTTMYQPDVPYHLSFFAACLLIINFDSFSGLLHGDLISVLQSLTTSIWQCFRCDHIPQWSNSDLSFSRLKHCKL